MFQNSVVTFPYLRDSPRLLFCIDKSWNDISEYNFSLDESHWDYIIDLLHETSNPNNQQTSGKAPTVQTDKILWYNVGHFNVRIQDFFPGKKGFVDEFNKF